jgi:hypothetical protein
MLKKPDVLRCALIDNWEKYCAKGICEQEVSLSATLKEYIQTFDFSIVWFKTVQEVLAQHQKTQHWYLRFKAQRPIRPDGLPPPDGIQPHEMAYTARLLEAYSDHLKIKMKSPEDLGTTPELYEHFKRSRGYFFSAEALARFSRDYYEAGAFDLVKQHIYDGVADLTLEPHRDGYACVLAVTKASATLPLPESNEIVPHVGPADKKGVCHHLANDGRLCWVKS